MARGPFWVPTPDPRLRRAELIWLEPAIDDLVRRLTLAIDLAAEIEGHEACEPLLALVEGAMARLRLPTATEAVVGRESRHTQSYERARAGNPFPALPLPDDARASALEADAWLTAELKQLQQRFPPQGAVALTSATPTSTPPGCGRSRRPAARCGAPSPPPPTC